MRAALAWSVLALLAGGPSWAQTASHAIAPGDIAALPQVDLDVAFETEDGPEHGHYAGALLWKVLDADTLIPAGAAKTRLVHSVIVTGRDGYAVAVAFGEIDPFFEGKSVVLATRRDGHAIGSGEVRLIVPGDKHGGRSVHDVVKIEVR